MKSFKEYKNVQLNEDTRERQKYLIRMAVLYMISNVHEANKAFAYQDHLNVNGEEGELATVGELTDLMRVLQ